MGRGRALGGPELQACGGAWGAVESRMSAGAASVAVKKKAKEEGKEEAQRLFARLFGGSRRETGLHGLLCREQRGCQGLR